MNKLENVQEIENDIVFAKGIKNALYIKCCIQAKKNAWNKVFVIVFLNLQKDVGRRIAELVLNNEQYSTERLKQADVFSAYIIEKEKFIKALAQICSCQESFFEKINDQIAVVVNDNKVSCYFQSMISRFSKT